MNRREFIGGLLGAAVASRFPGRNGDPFEDPEILAFIEEYKRHIQRELQRMITDTPKIPYTDAGIEMVTAAVLRANRRHK